MGREQPKVIFLDAVGTLFGVRGSVGEIYGQFASQAGANVVSPEMLNIAFYESFKAASAPVFPRVPPESLPEQEFLWWEAITYRTFAKAGILAQLGDFTVFFTPIFDYFGQAAPWIVYDDVLNALSYWQKAGIELGIISNFDTRLYQVLEQLHLKNFFQSITIASLAGAAKPEQGIFEAALAQHSASPQQAWHIGDSLREDYQGAQSVGIKSYWLNRTNQYKLKILSED